MVRTQAETNRNGENPNFIEETAKSAFKAGRKGGMPVALVLAGVAAVGGAVIGEALADAADPDVIVNVIEVF